MRWITGILAIGTLLPPVLFAAGERVEVWVLGGTNRPGTGMIQGSGTQADPYHGDFDAIINSIPANHVVHLMPGVYYTAGFQWGLSDPVLKSGQKVIGAGMDITLIRRDLRIHNDTAQMDGLFWSVGDRVEVSDLTVDASCTGTEKYKKAAVSLGGSYCAVRRVKAINTSGNAARGQECFSIYINASTNAVGNSVTECEVSSVKGSYCTAIALVGQGEVRSNRVIFPVVTNLAQGSFSAYQASGSSNALFAQNYSYGGGAGFYTDTYCENGLVLASNVFENVLNGIIVAKSRGFDVAGLTIRGNVIEISSNMPRPPTGWAYAVMIHNQDPIGRTFFRDVAIEDNLMRYFRHGRKGLQAGTSIFAKSEAVTNFVQLRIVGNTLDRSYPIIVSATEVLVSGNLDLAGRPLGWDRAVPGTPHGAASVR